MEARVADDNGDASPDRNETITRVLKSTGPNPFRAGLVLGAIVAVAMVLLIIQNGESAQLDWVVFHFDAPLWIMLILTAAAGAVVWEVIKVVWHRGRRLRRERRTALKAVKDLDA